MQIELKDRVKRKTVFQTYVFDYYFWVNLDDRCPHAVTVYPNFSIFSGVNCRSQFDMRRRRRHARPSSDGAGAQFALINNAALEEEA